MGTTQAARLRSKGVATLRDLALRGEASARKLLEACGLSSSADGRAGGRGGDSGGRGARGGGGGSVAAAMRALSAIPTVTEVGFGVRAAGGEGGDGVSFGHYLRFVPRLFVGIKCRDMACLSRTKTNQPTGGSLASKEVCSALGQDV